MSDTEDYDGRDEEYAEEDEERNEADSEEREEDEEHEDADTAVGQDEQPADMSEVAEEEDEDNEPPLVLEKEWEGFVRIKVPSAFALPPPPPVALGDTTLPEPMDETAIGGDSTPRGRGQDEDDGADGDAGYGDEDGEEGDQEAEEQEREYAAAPKVPFASIKHPPLQDARIYFQMDARVDRTMPPWMRYVLNNEPHFFDTLMQGKKVERPADRAAATALKKKLALKEAKRKAKAAKRKKKKIVEEEEEEVVPEPKEEILYDDDGHVVISHPFDGNTRFRLIQLTKSRPANARYNLPEIVVDDDELVFVAVVMEAGEVEVEENAWETEGAASLTPAPTGRAAAVLPTEVAIAVSKLHPPRDVSGARTPGQEEDGEAGDREEGEELDEEAEEDESRIKSSMSITGQVLDEENEEGEEDADGEPVKRGMEMRMDVMTLAALFCPRAFERGLMRHEALPNMALTTAWLEIYSDSVDGSTGTMVKEFHDMQANIVEGANSALTTKKTSRKPKEQEDNANDDDEERPEEVASPVEENQAPPAAPYAVRGEDGTYTIPKPKMDLSWTYIKEAHFPLLRREMRALRRAVGAHLLPIAPILPSTVCTTPEMTLSYLDYLMAIPRSALLGWTKPKLDDMPEEDIEDASEIALDPLSEEHLERPLSHMLGSILLDLRRRQMRKAHGKRDMKLGAFAAHKQALTTKFIESNTLLDPLVTTRYAVNALFEEAEAAIKNRHLETKTTFLQSWRAAADGEGPAPTTAADGSGADQEDMPGYWPAALRLYDSDLVALACARYGALETFQEILRIKVEHVSPPRLVDDTVGTYHLLLQLLPHFTEQCASFLLHFAANCVPVVPILTDHSIIRNFDFLDTLAQIDPSATIPADDADGEDPFKTIDGLSTKSTTLPRVIARNFWHRWAEDDGFMSLLKERASMVYDEVSLELTKFKGLIEAIVDHKITPSELDAKVLSTGADENDDTQGGKMEVRDVYSPVVMYYAIQSRNIPIIVHLATKHGIITVQESLTTGAAPVMEFIIEDDARRNADASDKPLSSRSTEDLLATHEERADGALSILLALVDNGMPASKEVFKRGVKGYISTLQDTFGKCKKLTQLIKRLNQREHERGTDPAQKYGILRYVPEHPKLAASPSKRVAMKYVAAPVDE